MSTELETKLLELTKHGRRLTLHAIANMLHTDIYRVESKIQALSEIGCLTKSGDLIEAETAQRMVLAERLIQSGHDPQHIARHLEWQEFEDFAEDSFKRNGFKVVKHFVFKTRNGRREIDLLAWSDTFVIAVDCKHWRRGLSPSSARVAAIAQIERVVALSERPEIMIKKGFEDPINRRILPVLFALCEPRERIVEGVPVVAVTNLLSFLYGISPLDDRFRMIPVKAHPEQTSLMPSRI